MPLSREEVLHIASLVRMGLSDQEVERMREQLSNILEQFQVLQDLDTADAPPTGRSVPLDSVMREDEPGPSLSKEETLSNAPRRQGDLFRVRVVLEE